MRVSALLCAATAEANSRFRRGLCLRCDYGAIMEKC
jgi:hypothetical protein